MTRNVESRNSGEADAGISSRLRLSGELRCAYPDVIEGTGSAEGWLRRPPESVRPTLQPERAVIHRAGSFGDKDRRILPRMERLGIPRLLFLEPKLDFGRADIAIPQTHRV